MLGSSLNRIYDVPTYDSFAFDAPFQCLYDYANATWREERERMCQGYKEAMQLRDTALHQVSGAVPG